MTLSFQQIEPKLGIELSYPPIEIEHCYLEHLLRLNEKLDSAQLWTGKLYDGVNEGDLERLAQSGKHLILASGRTAYFADASTTELIASQVYRHPNDAIAYGSLPVSEAQSSSVKTGKARILIIDDEAEARIIPPQVNNSGVHQETLQSLVENLGDCYMLVSPELADTVQAEPNTPFQFRAGSPDLLGMLKGTCRVSQQCEALGIDAIVPLSSTKGHGNTIQPGFYELEEFFLSRKSDAQLREQKLGIQALVNLPEGTLAEISPKLKSEAERLAEIQQDPRKVVDLYIQSTERRLRKGREIEADLGEESEVNQAKSDWLCELLKEDHNYELLQHDRVQAKLQGFLAGEWEDIATGGVYVPQALAQPHPDLQAGEVCIPSMLHQERVAIYRSPVANVAAFDVFVNNIQTIQNQDPEAFEQQGVCYLNANDAKRLVIDFDGDTVAIIRESEFPILVQEIIDKNRPEHKPIQVQKEQKIPRPWHEGQTYWQSLAAGALDAANNQVGLVANLGMTIESLRWEISYLPEAQKEQGLREIATHWQKLLDAAREKTFQIPTDQKLQQNGFAPYSFTETISSIVQTVRSLSSFPPEQRAETVQACLNQVQQILFNTLSLVAVNLQRAVDAPKSARGIDEQYQTFAQQLSGYKQNLVIRNKKVPDLYQGNNVIPVNTQDPIGSMVRQANQYFKASQLPVQDRKHFKSIFPVVSSTEFPEAQAFSEQYNALIRQGSQDMERSQTETEPKLIVTSSLSGKQLEVGELLKVDPEQILTMWKEAKKGNPLDMLVIRNTELSSQLTEGYLAKIIVNGVSEVVGTVSKETLEQQGIKLSEQQKLIISKLNLEFCLNTDKEIVAKGFKQANRLLENFVQSIPQAERSDVAAYLWHNGGQAACLKAFPQEVIKQLQIQTMKLNVVGLQFPNNELQGRVWLGESVPIRIALDDNPSSYNHNRAILQVGINNGGDRTWKYLGPLGEAAQLPIGTEAQAKIHGVIAKVSTSRGNELFIRNTESHDLAGQDWQGAAQMKFHRQGNRVVASIEHEGTWKNLGTLEKDSVARLRQQESSLKRAIIDSPSVLRDVQISAVPSLSAQVILDRETIQYPEHWRMAPKAQSTEQQHNDRHITKGPPKLVDRPPTPTPTPTPVPSEPQIDVDRRAPAPPAQADSAQEISKSPPVPLTPEQRTQAIRVAKSAINFLESEGCSEFKGNHWQIKRSNASITITNLSDSRVILGLAGKELQYAPQPEDRERLEVLVKNCLHIEQQKPSISQNQRGPRMR
jgi:hypothetical protein